MDLEAFSQDEKPFETRTDLDEYDEALDDGQELDESSSSGDPDDDQTQEPPDSAKIGDKFSSPEELMQAYKTAESRMLEKAREAEEYRRMLDQMGHDAGLASSARRMRKPSYRRCVNPSKRTRWQQQP